MIVASGATPALAASAEDSIVGLDALVALDAPFRLIEQGASASKFSENYGIHFYADGPVDDSGITAKVALLVKSSAEEGRQSVQGTSEYWQFSYGAERFRNMTLAPSDAYGDAGGQQFFVDTASDAHIEARLFVENATVVEVWVFGPTTQADLIKASADTLAAAQDALLLSNA
jgi:hypothetical protein